ncbi:beta-glucosidase 24-like [Prunus dulcis]|uniref:beta-glucosidase 24-like n=1 Tax=Prunus dulcis TaxID=3755 RepID=UPI0014838ADC|nr:beta-glucosidase 24-like [Prunus dulcis]
MVTQPGPSHRDDAQFGSRTIAPAVCGATRIASGEYPLRMLAILGRQLSKFTRAQSKLLAGSLDFLGINYYASYYASDAHKSSYSSYTTDSRVTFSCVDEFNNPKVSLAEVPNDTTKMDYYKHHIYYIQSAIRRGDKVKGYFPWSF